MWAAIKSARAQARNAVGGWVILILVVVVGAWLTLRRKSSRSAEQRDISLPIRVTVEARNQLSAITREDHWLPLRDQRNAIDPLSDESLRELLLEVGKTALHAMLAESAGREAT